MSNPVDDETVQATLEVYEQAGRNISETARRMGINFKTVRKHVNYAATRGMLGREPVIPTFEIAQVTTVLNGDGDVVREFIQQRPESGEDAEFIVPLDHSISGVSALVDAQGNIKQQWIKTREDAKRTREFTNAIIEALKADIVVRKPVEAPTTTAYDLLTVYAIADIHLGMYAWGEECGDDYDSYIARTDLINAADRLLAASPDSDECLIASLGDFFHMDNSSNMTPRSGNRLDVDTRFPKVVSIGIKTVCYWIDAALLKHKTVRVRIVLGNHDPHASIILAEAIKARYHNEPRVIVETSPAPLWHFRFGTNLLAFTHGHAGKPDDIIMALAHDAKDAWGSCEHKHVLTGHIHQKRVIEKGGCTLESFRTIAAKDFFAAENMWRPGREMQSIVYHYEYGEIERHTAGIRLIREGQHGN